MVLLLSFAVALASALVPFVNIEVYLAGLATQVDAAESLGIAAVAGLGQTLGKVAWYEVARRGVETERGRRLLAKKGMRPAFERWQLRTTGRPLYAGAVLAVSSLAGFPPLLAMAVVAGALRMQRGLFVVVVLVCRVLRFYLLVAGVELFFVDRL